MKKFLILITMVIALSACSSTPTKIASGSDIKLVVATDIHLLAKELMTNGDLMAEVFEYGDGRFVSYSNEIMSTLAYTVKANKADILVLSGDITNDGEKASHLALVKQLKEIEKNGTRVFVVPGNHDLENPFAKDYAIGGWKTAETISAKDFESIYKDFGFGEAISRDPSGLSYLAAPAEDVYLLMLDSNKYGMLNMPSGSGKLSQATLDWIKEATQLARDNNAQIITVMHHNVMKHSERLYEGYVISNSEDVLPLFDQLNLNIVLSGHMHAQDIKTSKQTNNTIYDIVTSSMSIFPMNYGVVEYQKGKGFNYHFEPLDVQAWAQVNSTDTNLLNFNEYAKDMNFIQNYNRAINSLIETDVILDSNISLSDETIMRLKNENFNGVIRQIKNELLILNGYTVEESTVVSGLNNERVVTAVIPEQIIKNTK